MTAALRKFYDVVRADDLPEPFDSSHRCQYEITTESLPGEWGGWCCYRPVWDDSDRCIWHAEEPRKPPEELHQAQEYERTWPSKFSEIELTRRLDRVHLRNYQVDTERRDSPVHRPLSFSSCTMFGSNFYNSNLSGSSFQNVHLNRSNFEGAICNSTLFQRCTLDETIFKHAHLEDVRILRQSAQDANWRGVRLDGANLHDSDFTDTNLCLAKFRGTKLTKATLKDCDLEEAELENTDLRDADLRNAALYETLIREVRINEGTLFGQVCDYETKADREAANLQEGDCDSILNPVRNAFDRFVSRFRGASNDAEPLNKAVRVYRVYQRLLREASLPEDIRLFRVQEKHSRRKLALRESRYLQWLKLSFDRWVMLYGESPKRVIGASILVIFAFSVLYSLFGRLEPAPTTAGQFLYFSAATFTALVYGDLQPANETARILASIESFTGALLMALLVFVLGRRATW